MENTVKFSQSLQQNEIAILVFDTQEVEIIEVPNLDEVEDVEEVLSEMGYNTDQIHYMVSGS